MTLHAEMAMPDSQQYTWNLYLFILQNCGRNNCFWLEVFISASFSTVFNSKCTSHHKWTKILISNSYLIRQRYKGYRSKSDIVRLARRFTCNNAYSPFNCLNHLGISCIKYSFYQQKINSSIKKSSSLLTISFN